jgi:hypothetical protein
MSLNLTLSELLASPDLNPILSNHLLAYPLDVRPPVPPPPNPYIYDTPSKITYMPTLLTVTRKKRPPLPNHPLMVNHLIVDQRRERILPPSFPTRFMSKTSIVTTDAFHRLTP